MSVLLIVFFLLRKAQDWTAAGGVRVDYPAANWRGLELQLGLAGQDQDDPSPTWSMIALGRTPTVSGCPEPASVPPTGQRAGI